MSPRDAETELAGRRVIIVGGGASGVLLACHLLRLAEPEWTVTLIERRPEIGQGVAFGTANPDHVLNVRAGNMSALADDPDHFWRWLVEHRVSDDLRCADPFCFAPRQVYGQYIASLSEPLRRPGPAGRLEIIRAECLDVRVSALGISATLSDGSVHKADLCVLATGHEMPAGDPASPYVEPWTALADLGIGAEAPVLILGTGLTMVDQVLALCHAGHRGPITAMSRRGLLPHVHRRTVPWRIDAGEVPFGDGAATLTQWLRGLADRIKTEGGDWRSAVDAVRPFTQELWQKLPVESRRRFLRHARAWWDVHRHRMAPDVEQRLAELIAQGQLRIVAGKVCSLTSSSALAVVTYRRRGEQSIETMQVAKIIDCTGFVTDPLRTTNPALLSLLRQGYLRADPLRIGIDVSDDCAIINHSGEPSERLFAVGPLTRAAFWEVIAIPDIRVQCAALAKRLTTRMVAATGEPR
jgi:uncharacterized NAD(P)/FAD-binding protein YdhS